MRARCAGRTFPGTSRSTGRWNGSGGAQSCGTEPLGILLNPFCHFVQVVAALDVRFAVCDELQGGGDVLGDTVTVEKVPVPVADAGHEIGRASCRERV